MINDPEKACYILPHPYHIRYFLWKLSKAEISSTKWAYEFAELVVEPLVLSNLYLLLFLNWIMKEHVLEVLNSKIEMFISLVHKL